MFLLEEIGQTTEKGFEVRFFNPDKKMIIGIRVQVRCYHKGLDQLLTYETIIDDVAVSRPGVTPNDLLSEAVAFCRQGLIAEIAKAEKKSINRAAKQGSNRPPDQ